MKSRHKIPGDRPMATAATVLNIICVQIFVQTLIISNQLHCTNALSSKCLDCFMMNQPIDNVLILMVEQ